MTGKPGGTFRVPYYGFKGDYQKIDPLYEVDLGAHSQSKW